MNIFIPTKELVQLCDYSSSPTDFFSHFSSGWDRARGQVIKLETRQSYVEPGNESLNAALSGDLKKSVELIPITRSCDDELYDMVAKKRLQFIRCRSVETPRSVYLDWELEVYKYNSRAEQITCFNYAAVEDFFDQNIQHDFMVFDASFAVIHNYDQVGEIQGGWFSGDQKVIRSLLANFSFLKANSQDFRWYLDGSRYNQ